MELSSSNIESKPFFLKRKLLLYFLKKKHFLYFQNGALHFSAEALKIKEIGPEKTSYTSENEDFEKISCVFSKESFSYILGKGNPE